MILKSLCYSCALMIILLHSAWSEILVIPFHLDQVDSATAQTINELFAESYQSFSKAGIRKPDSIASCRDKVCALEAGKKAEAAEVVYGVARKLGEKWIVSGWRIKVADGSVLASDRLDGKSIEDFEFVMKRMAEGLATGKKIEETASVDNVTESEMSDGQYRRREGFYALGLKFGFLFPPSSDYYSRYDNQYLFGGNPEFKSYSQILNTDFINWFELPKDLALEWDIHIGWQNEIGTHFSLLKLFSRRDFTPFAGGGIGIDYVFPDEPDSISKNKRNAGFAFNGKVGLMLFRTYSFRVFTSVGYKVVLNSDLDQGVCADLGILWKKHKSSERSGSPLVGALAIIGGIVLGLTVLGIAAGGF